MSLPRLGKKLGYLERRWSSSLARHQKAVRTFARLADLHPEEFLPDLASSLHDQGVALCNLGRAGEALESIRRSVELHRRVAASDPRAADALVLGLDSLGTLLDALGREEEAVAAWRERDGLQSAAAAG